MLKKALLALSGGLILYVVAKISYETGKEVAKLKDPIFVYGPKEAPFIPLTPEEDIPKSKGSKIGLLFKLNKAFGKKSTSGLKDLLDDPDNLHIESYYEDGVLKVNIKKRTA